MRKNVISWSDRWAIGVYHALMQNRNSAEKDAAMRAIFRVAVGEDATVWFAARVCHAVLS
jgi:hypothetical protein